MKKINFLVDLIKGKLCKVFYGGKIRCGKRFCIKTISNLSLYKKSSLKIGAHVRINKNVAIGNFGEFVIDNHVSINRNCVLVCKESIYIGEHTSIGPNVLIYDHDHKFGISGKKDGFKTSPVRIGENVWIGGGCIILRGSTIGDNCVIGAGCVISGNIPANSLVTNNSRDLNIVPLK